MKQYFTGFFTAVCLTASAFLFMGAQNKNLGDVTVKSLRVKDDEGRTMVLLSSFKLGGAIDIWNKDNEIVASLTNSDNSGGIVKTYNADDKMTSYLGTGKGGIGFLETFNGAGVRTGYFGTNNEKDGMITLSDRYGDIGWSASGKK